MRLDISQALKAPGQPLAFSFAEKLDPMTAAGEEIRFEKPVEVRGSAVFTGEDFFLRGDVHADYVAVCSRCLREVSSRMDISFTEEFAKTEDENHPDRYLYSGEELELSQMVGDLIALNTPMRHLCSEDCKGLCPVCGIDRNLAQCSCPSTDDSGTN